MDHSGGSTVGTPVKDEETRAGALRIFGFGIVSGPDSGFRGGVRKLRRGLKGKLPLSISATSTRSQEGEKASAKG